MLRHVTVIQTKVRTPTLTRRAIMRKALLAQIRDYRLVLVHAPTGYGKTTVLAQCAQQAPAAWFSPTDEDRDPASAVHYLSAACRHLLSEREIAAIGVAADWRDQLSLLLNALGELRTAEPLTLVLDDVGVLLADDEPAELLEHLIRFAPPNLRLILSSRRAIGGRLISGMLVRGEAQRLQRSALAFSADETAQFLLLSGRLDITESIVAQLQALTEGWPVALQLLQQLGGGLDGPLQSEVTVEALLARTALSDYLAGEIFGTIPPELQQFLLATAALNEFTAELCDAVRAAAPATSRRWIQEILRRDLFVTVIGPDRYRFHPVFRAFLRRGAIESGAAPASHRHAADWYRRHGRLREALEHLGALAAYDDIAELIGSCGAAMISRGESRTVTHWLALLPGTAVQAHPAVQCVFGDIERIHARFDAAVRWYQQAEASARRSGDRGALAHALHRQALVLVDQVQPRQAEELLAAALRVAEGLDDQQAQADLLELLAENRLNQGDPLAAEQLRGAAAGLRDAQPDDDLLAVRVMLRSGRLNQARVMLRRLQQREGPTEALEHQPMPRGHRETSLVLALIAVFLGDSVEAAREARHALALGRRVDSPFVISVGFARLGHAELLAGLSGDTPALARAQAAYDEALATARTIGVERLRVEPLWGLIRLAGRRADTLTVRSAADEARRICQWAGDLWLAAVIELATAQALADCADTHEALAAYDRAISDFRQCNDPHGTAAGRLGRLLSERRAGLPDSDAAADRLMSACAALDYVELLTRPTLLGAADGDELQSLLEAIRADGRHTLFLDRLGVAPLPAVRRPAADPAGAVRLRVQTLGEFRVVRDGSELTQRDWQRSKARRLFQLLALRRGQWLQREQLADLLWPDCTGDIGLRDLKIAFSAVYRALEPQRSGASTFIERRDGAYRLRPGDDIVLDFEQVQRACRDGRALLAQQRLSEGVAQILFAQQQYRGELLADVRYESWADDERRRLRDLVLQSSELQLFAFLRLGEDDAAVTAAEWMLTHDPLWERAYRAAMFAHARQGRRSAALRSYQRCTELYQRELDAGPSSLTSALAHMLRDPRAALPSLDQL